MVDEEGNEIIVADTCSAFEELVGVMSVQGVPTRLFPDAATLAITQPMRRSYGWDGCRERLDGRDEPDSLYGGFETELQWEKPVNRFSHRALYAPELHSLVMFGGMAYVAWRGVAWCGLALHRACIRTSERWTHSTHDYWVRRPPVG